MWLKFGWWAVAGVDISSLWAVAGISYMRVAHTGEWVGWGLGEKVMREKWATTSVIVCFCDALGRPPTFWVPLCVSPPQFHRRASMCLPASLWRGEGRVQLSSVLCIPGVNGWAHIPQSRGGAHGWVVAGDCRQVVMARVVARVVVVVEEWEQYQPWCGWCHFETLLSH